MRSKFEMRENIVNGSVTTKRNVCQSTSNQVSRILKGFYTFVKIPFLQAFLFAIRNSLEKGAIKLLLNSF